MILELQILDQKAELNRFTVVGTALFKNGLPLTLNMRLFDPETGLRYVPPATATFSIDFKMSDQTTVTKAPTVLDADDRSLLTTSLDASETALLIGQNLELTITDGAEVSVAIAQMAIKASKSSC